jgi:hypothetical protein
MQGSVSSTWKGMCDQNKLGRLQLAHPIACKTGWVGSNEPRALHSRFCL